MASLSNAQYNVIESSNHQVTNDMSTQTAQPHTPSTSTSSLAKGDHSTTSSEPGVHPSAVGSATKPSSSANQESAGNGEGQDQSGSDLDAEGYPPQKHAGKVGYGPQYNRGADLGDKMTGIKEEIKGKLTHKPEVAQRGKERRTGVLKKKELDQDGDSFANPEEKKAKQNGNHENEEGGGDRSGSTGGASPATGPTQGTGSSSGPEAQRHGEQAATVAPEGTHGAEVQRRGGNTEGTKQID